MHSNSNLDSGSSSNNLETGSLTRLLSKSKQATLMYKFDGREFGALANPKGNAMRGEPI